MKKLNFNIHINASVNKVWQVLWCDFTYRKWTSAFHEGSHAVSDWKEGSRIQFLTPEGNGMYSNIEQNKPKEYMCFRHIGEIKNFKEQPLTEETKLWTGGMEAYSLKEENGGTLLEVKLDAPENFLDYFTTTFPKASALVKKIAEQPVVLTIETTVTGTVNKVWEHWTLPKHITGWNFASDDWCAPKAENDLKPGGRFTFRMEAKDKSFGFDFGGTYTAIELHKKIEYRADDGRMVKIDFIQQGNTSKIIEAFEAEEENSLELQQGGWQSILNNFKKYSETN